MALIIPKDYTNRLSDFATTERAIKFVKDTFQRNLSEALNLLRVTASLTVPSGMGLNDDLSGVEEPVSFFVKGIGARVEIVHSLAKWKRMKLAQMGMPAQSGIYTDMNALRPEEDLDNIHSIYVDQWDWERVLEASDRNLDYLRKMVKAIYRALKNTENQLCEVYPQLVPQLPEEIYFIHSQELLDRYPNLSSKEREDVVTKEYGAVFIIGIGGELSNGEKHDNRASDYDDWSTKNEDGYCGLNGDILLWNDLLGHAFEISSMGIRVDAEALLRQTELRDEKHKLESEFHKALLRGELPLTIGGGIGQSRLCMYLLQKAHIGEVQSSVWSQEDKQQLAQNGIFLM